MDDPIMHWFFICVGIVLFLLMLPALWRVAVGPTVIDRIVGANVIGTKTAVLLIVIGTVYGNVGMFVDFALAYALLNFIGSLAAARYCRKLSVDDKGLTAPQIKRTRKA
jgi:multicomponent Na+:H+ antiporter subunit F